MNTPNTNSDSKQQDEPTDAVDPRLTPPTAASLEKALQDRNQTECGITQAKKEDINH